MKVVVEVKDGKVVGVYSDTEGSVEVYYDVNPSTMTDAELDELDDVVASVPYILYDGKDTN